MAAEFFRLRHKRESLPPSIQAAQNSLVSAIGVSSSGSTRIDKSPKNPSSRFPAKLIESRRARSRLVRNSTPLQARCNLLRPMRQPNPTSLPQAPSPPCEIMITVAFILPRAQLGIARCAATQSSEADIVHPRRQAPQQQRIPLSGEPSPLTRKPRQAANSPERVTESGEKRALSQGMMNTAPTTEPSPMLVNNRLRLDELRCNAFKPTTGINCKYRNSLRSL